MIGGWAFSDNSCDSRERAGSRSLRRRMRRTRSRTTRYGHADRVRGMRPPSSGPTPCPAGATSSSGMNIVTSPSVSARTNAITSVPVVATSAGRDCRHAARASSGRVRGVGHPSASEAWIAGKSASIHGRIATSGGRAMRASAADNWRSEISIRQESTNGCALLATCSRFHDGHALSSGAGKDEERTRYHPFLLHVTSGGRMEPQIGSPWPSVKLSTASTAEPVVCARAMSRASSADKWILARRNISK